MKKILGFTLSELMVAMVVLGILTAAVLPAILGNNPNQNKMMIKKAYYTTAEVVSEMVNDESLYPSISATGTHYEDNMAFYNMDAVSYDGKTVQGDTKFIDIFFGMINPSVTPENVSNDTSDIVEYIKSTVAGANSTVYRTKTKDGMVWYLSNPSAPFVVNMMLIDVNGDAKPNCFQGSTLDRCKNRTDNFDQFRMKIKADGTIIVNTDDTWAQDAITVSSSLRD